MRLPARPAKVSSRQLGGFVLGLVVGLLIGLALALGVALYVTKVPVPFLDKVPHRTPEQDAAEQEKNKNWDPNAPLAGKNPARPSAPPPAPAPAPTATRDPAAILADRPVGASTTAGNASAPLSTSAGADAFSYFVQTGAYSSADDAETQRGKLALLGFEPRISEREQSGRTVHRVRVGPFEEKGEADDIKEKLTAAGFEAALVPAPK